MTCRTVKLPDGTPAIVCGPKSRMARCSVPGCRRDASQLCDYPVGDGTCDKRLCTVHAIHIEPDTDFCPKHGPREAA